MMLFFCHKICFSISEKARNQITCFCLIFWCLDALSNNIFPVPSILDSAFVTISNYVSIFLWFDLHQLIFIFLFIECSSNPAENIWCSLQRVEQKEIWVALELFRQQPLHFNVYQSPSLVNTQKQYENAVLVRKNVFVFCGKYLNQLEVVLVTKSLKC